MKVTTYIINEGENDQEVILINAKEGSVLRNAPNDWKTKKAAIRWALNNGLEIVNDRKEPDKQTFTAEEFEVLAKRISKLEEKLHAYETAFQALRTVFKMTEEE